MAAPVHIASPRSNRPGVSIDPFHDDPDRIISGAFFSSLLDVRRGFEPDLSHSYHN